MARKNLDRLQILAQIAFAIEKAKQTPSLCQSCFKYESNYVYVFKNDGDYYVHHICVFCKLWLEDLGGEIFISK